MKIALTTSPGMGEAIQNVNPKYVLNDFIKYPPLALLSIVRDVDKEHEVSILDANEHEFDELFDRIVSFRPDVLGVSLVTERFYGALELIRRLRKALPGIVIVGGGSHTDIYAPETMLHSEFDYLLCGPCELTFPLFCDYLAGKKAIAREAIVNLYYRDEDGQVRQTDRKTFKNIDELPLPDRTRIDIRKYKSLSDRGIMTTMNSSRGCPFRCNFCNVPRYYMQRSAEKVIEEIEEIVDLGFNQIHILDDTFNINKTRVLTICNLIKQRNINVTWSTRARLNPFDDEMAAAMKDAGCFRLNVGVESHDPQILEYVNKKITYEDLVRGFEVCHRHKIETLAYFIIGFPGQTYEDAMKARDFIKKLKPTFILMNTLLPTPASDFYNELMSKGIYEKDYWREFVLNPVKDFVLPSWRGIDNDIMFLQAMDELMRSFYLSPSFVLKEVLLDVRAGRFQQLGRKIKIGLNMLATRSASADEYKQGVHVAEPQLQAGHK